MTRPKLAPARLRFEAARAHLGLARWQMRLLETCGRLDKAPDGTYGQTQVAALAADPDELRAYLWGEERLVSTQIAKALGTSPARVREAARDGIFISCESIPWRYGTVLRYRRAEIEGKHGDFDAWMAARRKAGHDFDPARAAARARQRAGASASRRQVLEDLGRELDAAESLPPAEAGLGLVAVWLRRLIGYYEDLKPAKSRSRSHAKALAAARSRLAVPLNDTLAYLAARARSGAPNIEATLYGDGYLEFCSSCLAQMRRQAHLRWVSDGNGVPGCANCHIDSASLSVFVSLGVGSLAAAHKTDLATAATWEHLGPRDELKQPSQLLLGEARAGVAGLNPKNLLRPPEITDERWRALSSNERLAIWQTWRLSIFAERLAGCIPHEVLPASLAHLPRRRGRPAGAWGHFTGYHSDRRTRQVIPAAMVVERLAGALDLWSGGAFTLRRA